MNDKISSFETLDLGSNPPISIPMETVHAVVTADDMVKDYADAFVKEAWRVNPLRAEQVELTQEEMRNYAKFLLVERIKSVDGDCPDWRHLKRLYIPVFLQYALRMVGEVTLQDRGLRIIPVMDDMTTISLNEAAEISDKVAAFSDDLQMVQDAMPRGYKGDVNVMSSALIAGYVRSIARVDHVSDAYICAFLGMKLQEEQLFGALYRIQYDDLEFIRSAIIHERRIL